MDFAQYYFPTVSNEESWLRSQNWEAKRVALELPKRGGPRWDHGKED